LAHIPQLVNTRFKSDPATFSKLEMRSLLNFLLVRSAIFLLFAVIAFPTLARAQSVFHFSKGVHMGDAILPPGDYVITSMDVKNGGAVLTFAPPNSPPTLNAGARKLTIQEGTSGDSSLLAGSFFAINNPRNQAMPYPEAEMIYLSACRVVEQEFSQSDLVRPQLSLLLGSETDRIFYPKREIQLKKWDNFKFAEGVVLLAVESMLPDARKYSLAQLALAEVDSIVDVRELKISRNSLRRGASLKGTTP
jgi:hypothetical protein